MTIPVDSLTTMNVPPAALTSRADRLESLGRGLETAREKNLQDDGELRAAFRDFCGQTFFGQLLAAMRKTVDKPAYFHGGRTEEVFQNQLDQVLSEQLSEAAAHSFTDPMFELFTLQRR